MKSTKDYTRMLQHINRHCFTARDVYLFSVLIEACQLIADRKASDKAYNGTVADALDYMSENEDITESQLGDAFVLGHELGFISAAEMRRVM